MQKQTKKNQWVKNYISGWSAALGGFPTEGSGDCSTDAGKKKLEAIQNILNEIQSNAAGYDSSQIEKDKAAGNWLDLGSLCSGTCEKGSCKPAGVQVNSGGPWNLHINKDTERGTSEYVLSLAEQDSGSFTKWTDEQTLEISASKCQCCE